MRPLANAVPLVLIPAQALALAVMLAPAFAADGAAPLPLPGPGTEAAADAQHLLISLAEGARDPQWPERPAALPDEGDDGLALRWQWELPAVLARLGAQREAAIRVLDRHCLAALGETSAPNLRLGIALDHLPAPSARAELAAAIGRAWDRGRLRTVVALAAAAARAETVAGGATVSTACDPRAELAQQLLAGGATDPLPLPGLPEPLALTATAASPSGAAAESGLTITWAARPGWVFGLDAAGRVAWQRAVPLAAEELWGDGGAVLRSAEGLEVLDETGAARALGPLPERARLSAVAGGAAWFVLDAQAWRVALPGSGASAMDLGEEPVAPPLAVPASAARPWRSLWLTAHAVVWWPGDGQLQVLRHGLPVGPGWTLRWDAGDGALIVAPDGRRWRLPARSAAGAGDKMQQVRLAIATGAAQYALDLLAGDPGLAATLAGRRAALAAHVALGAEHLRSSGADVVALAKACGSADPVLAAAVLYAVVEVDRAGPHGVSATAGASAGMSPAVSAAAYAAFTANLLAAKSAQPQALYSRKPDEVLDDPAQWRHALSADGLSLAVDPVEPVETPSPPGHGWTWAINHPSGWTEVTCHDGAGALMWRHRWPTDDGQPSRALARSGDWLLVAEGQDRLLLLTAATGDIVLAAPLDGMTAPPESECVLSPRRLAVLEPPGVDDHLVIFDAGGLPIEVDGPVPWALPSTHPLPAPARTLSGDGGVAVVTLADGRVLRF